MLKLLPATAGIYLWYIPLSNRSSPKLSPALAGIYWWYKPHRLHNPLHLPPATAGIYRLYIPLIRIEKIKDMPALAGIYWWYISSHTNHLYIICTKIKIFLAFLQENL